MTRLSTLTRLRDMVRNADGPSDEVACQIDAVSEGGRCLRPLRTVCGDAGEREFVYEAVDNEGENCLIHLSELEAPDRTLDGAYKAAERLFPGCKIALADVGPRHTAHIKYEGLEAAAYGNTRPLAILDCLLSILIAREEEAH